MTGEPPGSPRPSTPAPAPAPLPRNLPQRYAAVATVKAPLAARLATWLDQRTGYSTVVRLITDEPIPGGARWWYVFGAVLTFLLALEFLTGMVLASAYAPSVTTAWASTAFIQDTLALGWFIRGLHSFGSTAMIVLAGIHLAQVLIFGAYKAPREMNWLVGLAMLGLLVVFALTGHGLPWDERGYWATQVETSIVGTVPLVGSWLQTLLEGGNSYGNYTVTRFYALHTFLLPSAIVFALAVHLFLVRRHGVTPRWNRDEAALAQTTQSYWPGQALRDTTACGVTMVILAMVVIKTHGAPLDAPVDPLASIQARPEWYALPLFQLRHYFGGALELVGTMVIPGVAAMLLAALPWLDAGPSRDPLRRKLVMVGALFGAAALGVLGYLPLRQDQGDALLQRARTEAAARSRRARELARGGVPPEGGLAVFRNDPLYPARELWDEHCAECHAFTGGRGDGDASPPKGPGPRGPDLKAYNTRQWIEGFLRSPDSPRFMGGAKLDDGMKAVVGTDQELRALTELVYAETGATDVDRNLVESAESLFSDKDCDSCHYRDGTNENTGPNLKGRGTLPYLIDIIADSADRRLYGEKAKMPRFADKLSPDEIAQLARFVLTEAAK